MRTIKIGHHDRGGTVLRRASCGLLLLLGTGCIRPGPTLTARHASSLAPHSYEIGVVREGWHTGIIIPTRQLTGPLASIRPLISQTSFVGIGWGNRHYYRDRHPSLLSGLRALFPSRSVLHVTAWSHQRLITLSQTKHLYWVGITAHGWDRLQSFLTRSFTLGPADTVVAVGPKTRGGNFFASPRTYDAWHTCNTWTADALRTIGFREQGPVLFAGQVTAGLHRFTASPRPRKALPPYREHGIVFGNRSKREPP